MEGLPKLPGLDFENRVKLNHHLAHSLDYRNGYRIPRKPPCGIGGDPLKEDSLAFPNDVNDPTLYDPVLTYGTVKRAPVVPFKPLYVLYDKMALTFFGFFKESVPESAVEHYRIRHVNIIYFLEDNSITVMEPKIRNCGFSQGRLVRRSKVPKNIRGDLYTWKDLNIGIDIELNGIVFHITDCDGYTKEFMVSQGIKLNEAECMPVDPVATERFINTDRQVRKTPLPDDKLRRYLEFQGKVLNFDCVLDETDYPYGECLTYKLFYYLEDDTVAIKELKENREGRDHFPMLLKKTKLPRNWKRQPVTFPAVFLEISEKEIAEYYQPKDFRVGETIYIFGRKFLLLDCDKFTRTYYEEILKLPQGEKLAIKFPEKAVPKRVLPDYNGLGTPEDSLSSCFGLVPKPPKKDIIKLLLNANKYLRYLCVLDTAHPEDKIRKFILCYSLADGTISISEPPIRNSGIIGGKFLASTRICRPGTNPHNPEYYTAKDFYIGAILIINAHRMVIRGADLYVYHYMIEHPEYFTKEIIDNVRKYHLLERNLTEELKDAMISECNTELNPKETYTPEEKSKLSTYEDCLKRVHVVADEKTKLEPVPMEHLTGTPVDFAKNECPFPIIHPVIETTNTYAIDKCQKTGGNQKNPHKNVTFKE